MKTVSRAFSLRACAKLNLRLQVGSSAGPLHTIVSVTAQLELADELHFGASATGFRVACDRTDIPERDNLAWRAAHALSIELPDVCISVDKKIPLQAGLGGGSSDAATALLGLSRILEESGAPISFVRLAEAAQRTGSDVPSLLVPGLKIVSGVGERVTRRDSAPPPWGIALLQPGAGSSTAQAYKLLDDAGVADLGADALASAEAMCAAYALGDFNRVLALLHNDFADVIERALPEVAWARERLERAGASATILCGSGSCIAGFFENLDAARDALKRVKPEAFEWAAATSFARDK